MQIYVLNYIQLNAFSIVYIQCIDSIEYNIKYAYKCIHTHVCLCVSMFTYVKEEERWKENLLSPPFFLSVLSPAL